MRKKPIALFFILITMLFLVGFGKKEIELLDGKKLIDLSKAIEYAKPGGDLEENVNAGEASSEQSETENVDANVNKTSTEDIEEGEKIIVISIRDQTITYNGISVVSVDKLEEYIRRDHKEKVQFTLVDDWAEAHQYRSVVAKMKELHSEIGLEFSME